MRLIDADLLKTVKEIQMGNFNSIEGIQAWVDTQPTAYKADKVIEQLEIYLMPIVGRKSKLYNTVLDIVRKGGV